MATPAETTPVGELIAHYLQDAETGRTRDAAGGMYSPAALRSVRRSLEQVSAAAQDVDAGALTAMNDAELEQLGRQVVIDAGLPPSRLGSIVHALRCLSAYAAGRRSAGPPPAEPLSWADPPRWTDPPRWAEPPPPRAAEAPPAPEPDPEARTPTFAMLALGAHASTWIERIIVIAFVLTAIGLALELA